jgi:hypothetical protein
MKRALRQTLALLLSLLGAWGACAAPKGTAKMKPAPQQFAGPLICLWQHEQQVDIAPLVKALRCNVVWTDDAPYHGQDWKETHMYRALQVPGIRYVIPKIERIQWGQTHAGSLKHAKWIGELSRTHKEIIGLYLNDFYDEIEEGYRTLAQWREIIATAKAANPDLAIWVPHYPHRGNERQAYDFDYQGVIFNLWDPNNLTEGEKYLTQAEAQHKGKIILAGLYLDSGAHGGHWLTEREFKDLLGLYVKHVQSGKLSGVRIFCACQLAARPAYLRWAQEAMVPLWTKQEKRAAADP